MSDSQDERRAEQSLPARQAGPLSGKKVWLITGAGRGLGVDIAQAALAAGNTVVATGRNTDAVSKAVGQADDLLVVKLDITSQEPPPRRFISAKRQDNLAGLSLTSVLSWAKE